MSFTYEYSRPALTVDLAIFRTFEKGLRVLAIRRGRDPFKGCLALPGGFVEEGEDPLLAAARELQEETGVSTGNLQLIGVYGQPGRDPRGHTVSVLYGACVDRVEPTAGDDAAEAFWADPREMARDDMAFDHDRLLADALNWFNSLKSI